MTALETIGAFERDLVVQAGAGTGKTHALVTLYLNLVTGRHAAGEPISPSRILVITFTDKAAGELRERIARRVAELLDDHAVPKTHVHSVLAELPRAPIGTFHAFGQSLLRRHAFASGIAPDFALLDDVEARARQLDAARGALLDALRDEPDAQALVDTYGFGGRERNGVVEQLVRLRGQLAEEGRSADGIARGYDDLASAKLDAIETMRRGLEALTSLRDAVGPKSVPRLDVIASIVLDGDLEPTLSRLHVEIAALKPNKSGGDVLRDAKQLYRDGVSAYRDAQATERAAPFARAIERLVAETERRYAAWKREASVVDFADLLRLPRDLLRSHAAIAKAEAERFDALLVDEFQDTNAVQADLVAIVAEAKLQDHGRRFLVGDRKQSIYEFRGADVAVFTEVAEALRRAGAHEVLLRRSFRSTPRVVALCNALFAHAFGGADRAEPWALSFAMERDALSAHRDDGTDAGAELLRAVIPDDVKRSAEQLRRLEARAIADRMVALVERGRRPGELALLLRRYTHLSVYLDALRRRGVPYYVVRGRGFYESQEIRDLASLVLWLLDEDDRLARVAVLRSPLCGLSDEGLAALAIDAPLEEDDRSRLDELSRRMDPLREQLRFLGPPALLREIIDRFELRAILAGGADGAQRIANLDHLVARADELARDPRGVLADLPGFARWLGRAVRPQAVLHEAGAQIVDERDDVVRVMSIHQSKGLQFPVVFVADCGAKEASPQGPVYYDAREGLGLKVPGSEAGTLVHTTPSRRVAAVRTDRQRAESLRLFYVAATRAQDRVVFSGERSDSSRSWRAHLDELPDRSLLDVVDPTPSERSAPRSPARAEPIDVDALPAWRPLRPTHARSLRIAVTQLQDFALCPRRYHLLHGLRLEERPGVPPVDVEEADRASDPVRAGTLAHALLERCTFTNDAELEALVRDAGLDPDDEEVGAIVDHVRRLLRTDFARALPERRLRRELPFTLALRSTDGARLLRGQIDLLVLDETGVTIVDYKLAHESELERYRFQLEAYAIAVRALYPRAPRIVAGIAFLRADDPSPRFLPLGDLDAIEARMSETADALARARLSRSTLPVERATCEAIGCGFVDWCHPR